MLMNLRLFHTVANICKTPQNNENTYNIQNTPKHSEHTITTHSKHNGVLKSPPVLLKHPNIYKHQFIRNTPIHSKHPNTFETPQFIKNTPIY